MHIHQPLHTYFESELEALHAYFSAKKDKYALAIIEPELALRREETKIVKSQKYGAPKKHERLYKVKNKFFR